MAIKKQIQYDGRKIWGYVDIGTETNNENMEPASETLVLMVTSVNAHWKIPIGYFFIKSLSATEKANIVSEALTRLNEIGVEITSVTCDGPSAHFAMFNQLGCELNQLNNLKPYFPHPSNPNRKVNAIFDTCHMLKLTRNCLADYKVLVDPAGNKIKWDFIEKLHNLQETEALTLANKLGKRHMSWKNLKMKVSYSNYS